MPPSLGLKCDNDERKGVDEDEGCAEKKEVLF